MKKINISKEIIETELKSGKLKKEICEDLHISIGVFNIIDGSKTFTVGVPESFPSEECAIAYVRGCMDGDGSYSKSGFGVRLTTGSEQLVYGISNIISKYTNQTVPVYLERDKYPTIALSKRKARIILNWIYSLDDCFKLDRKFCIYKKVNDMV